MTFSIGMRTIQRSGADYLSRTLARLGEVGLYPLCADRRPRVLGLHISDGTGLDISSNENGCRAIELALQDNPEWVLFLEDDIDVIDDFIGSIERWLADHEQPTIHIYPLGCNYSQCFTPEMTAWRYRTGAYYGSQALLLRASRARAFVAYVRTYWLPNNGNRAFDLALARWHESIEPEQPFLLTPVPCFVDHLGSESTFGYNVGRFAGFGGHAYSYRSGVAVG